MPAAALTARGPDSTSAEPQISLIWVSMSSSTKPPRLPSAAPLSAAPAEAPGPAGSGSVGKKNMTDGQLFSRFSCVSSLSSGGRCGRVDSRARLQCGRMAPVSMLARARVCDGTGVPPAETRFYLEREFDSKAKGLGWYFCGSGAESVARARWGRLSLNIFT